MLSEGSTASGRAQASFHQGNPASYQKLTVWSGNPSLSCSPRTSYNIMSKVGSLIGPLYPLKGCQTLMEPGWTLSVKTFI